MGITSRLVINQRLQCVLITREVSISSHPNWHGVEDSHYRLMLIGFQLIQHWIFILLLLLGNLSRGTKGLRSLLVNRTDLG